MEYELYKEESKPHKTVILQLDKTLHGNVQLVAVDSTGKRLQRGTLLLLNQKGRVHRCKNVSDALGFDLDSDGRIRISFSIGGAE